MTVFGPPNGNPSPEIIAHVKKRGNAVLVAAAPDMYAALKGILEHGLYDTFDTGIGAVDEANEWHIQALAIIGKIEGGG